MQLLEGEHVVWEGRPSWRSMLAFYIKWGLVALVPGVLTFPLYFGSTAFMPHDLLPGWLQWFNVFNPINYLITADRALMSSHWDWHAIGGALLTSLIVGALTMPLATRAFRRAVSS